jgi:hypothetical protein
MEFKGTKGKWQIKEKNASIIDENEKSIVCWHGVATSTFWKDEVELKSNSLLISKAPEMLEMLNWFANEFEDVFHEGTETNDMVLKAKQLIKEATEIQ